MSKKDSLENEKLSTESYKGVRDFYPEDQAFFKYLTATMREVVELFGYAEYHASILEPSELYKAKTSEEIINDQTYSFVDRGGREVTLRPEMTPTVARMVAAKRRELGFPLRLFSIPNVFRYERPQRGRLREHWQLNVDIFGSSSLEAEAEIISVAHALMLRFGATQDDFEIKIGSRNFLNALKEELKLDDAGGKKLFSLLDRRAKMDASEFAQEIADLGVAAEMLETNNVPEDVAMLLPMLAARGITNAHFAPEIVRGFDYYSGIVFEVYDTNEGNNRSLFGGGRYDNLLALFDTEQVPAVGFGMGDVTIKDFLEVRGLLPAYEPAAQVYIACATEGAVPEAIKLAEELRKAHVGVAVDFADRKLGDQIKNAAKHKIAYVMVVGQDEISSGSFKVSDMASGEESTLTREELAAFFNTAQN